MISTLVLLTCIGAATVGGVFFAFSTFVMRALEDLPSAHGVEAMQRINVVVLNPLFLGTFLGTAVLSAISAAAALVQWDRLRSPWLLAAGAFYLGGSLVVTMAGNVPRNNRLAALDPHSQSAHQYWSHYVREWSSWNHVRTAASLAAAVCNAVALAL